jgi:tRNA-modifying protein YgfZ
MTETSPAAQHLPVPAIIRLDDRALIAIAGAEAAHFLHNLVTSDIEGLKPGEGRLAALLTPQGKIIADMLVFNASDEEPLYLIDVARGFADDIVRKLALYRLRAQISIDLLPAETAIVVCLDSPPVTGESFYTFADPREAALGQRLYGPVEAIDAATAGLAKVDAGIFHARRVALVIPEGGKDYLAIDTFPHEANFDQLGGVDFKKGCYIGQEVVSRMQHRGTARTRALGVRFLNGFGVVGGAEIRAGEKIIGRIGESFGDRAIGFIRLDRLAEAMAAGETPQAGGVPIEIEKPRYASFTMASE